MATLNHFPVFHSLSTRTLCPPSESPLPYFRINPRHNCHFYAIFASSSRNSPRGSRKSKSDEDLCKDIREFLSNVGLPENHVPTMKELSSNGRQDLANIVRRRGYKFIRQLLEASSTENYLRSNIDTGTDEELQLNDQISVAAESNTLSMQEKMAKFIRHGELDTVDGGMIEDVLLLIFLIDLTLIFFLLRTGSPRPLHPDSGFVISNEEGNNTELEDSHEAELAFNMRNGKVPSSAQSVEEPVLGNSISSYISTKELTRIGCNEDLDDEKEENQAEVKRLKFLLHQKELELTHLKQQIEKEKLALSLIQTKAEKVINKAQELNPEKETELQTAEETLSGLKEVEILYSGDGDVVELAGSFNGWHHKIPMEPQLSSHITDPTGPRTSRLWRAFLWLYPGVYEIKFVVDGDWRIDPQRESTTRLGLHNNVLRVDR